MVIDLRDRAEKDPQPILALKRVAAEIATTRIYGHEVWPEVRARFRRADEQWRAPVADVYAELVEVNFAEIADESIDEAHAEIDRALAEWRQEYVRPGIEVPDCVLRFDPTAAERALSVKILGDLTEVLVDRLASARKLPGERHLYFLEIATARDELARLLENMLVRFFEGAVHEARTGFAPQIVSRGTTEIAAKRLKSLLAAVSVVLNALAERRKTRV